MVSRFPHSQLHHTSLYVKDEEWNFINYQLVILRFTEFLACYRLNVQITAAVTY